MAGGRPRALFAREIASLCVDRGVRFIAAVVAGVLLYCALLPGLPSAGDLAIYAAAARADNPYNPAQLVVAMHAGRVVAWAERWADRGCSAFFYPPLIWVLMKPLAALDYRTAFAAMTAATTGAFTLLVARTPRRQRLDFAFLALPTVAMNIVVGQVNLLLVALADLGLCGLAAVAKPMTLAGWRSRREAAWNFAAFGLMMLGQALVAPALFGAWLANLGCLDDLGRTGAWQAGIRALMTLPEGLRRTLWITGVALGGPLGLALAAFLTPASWIPYDAFFLPLLRQRMAAPAARLAWALMMVGNLPFLPPWLAALGRLAILTESAICGIKGLRPAGGSPRAGRFLLSQLKEVCDADCTVHQGRTW